VTKDIGMSAVQKRRQAQKAASMKPLSWSWKDRLMGRDAMS